MNLKPLRPEKTDLLFLLIIMLCALALQLICGLSYPLGYDECWHIFYAAVDPLSKSLEELRKDAHPPLPYLLLRPLVRAGDHRIWPRLISILAGIIQIPLFFLIVRKLKVARPVAYLGTAVFTGSHVFTVISITVRAYSIATLFLMAAILQMLNLLPETGKPARSHALGALAFLSLAVWCLYSSLLVTGVMALAMILLGLSDRRFGRNLLNNWRAHTRWFDWTGFLTCHLLVFLWFSLVWKARPLLHLKAFFPGEGESLPAFAFRGTVNMMNLFVPVKSDTASVSAIAILAFIASMAFLLWTTTRLSSRRRNMGRALIILALPLLWLSLLVLGVLEMHPFGGKLRHQYFMFPLIILLLIFLFDEVYGRIQNRLLHAVLCGGILILAISGSIYSFRNNRIGEFPDVPLWKGAARHLFIEKDKETPIYMNAYPFNAVFTVQRYRGWHFEGPVDRGWDEFKAGMGTEKWTIYRDRRNWTVPHLPDETFFQRLRRLFKKKGLSSLRVFTARAKQPSSKRERLADKDRLAERCRKNGFELESYGVLRDGEIYELSPLIRTAADPPI